MRIFKIQPKRDFYILVLTVVLLFYTTTLFKFMVGAPVKGGEYIEFKYVNPLVLALITFVILPNIKKMIIFFYKDARLLAAILLLIGASNLWAFSVSTGLWQSTRVILPILLITALYVSEKHWQHVRKSFVIFFIALAVGNIIFPIFVPDYGLQKGIIWTGIIGDRNYSTFYSCMAFSYFFISFLRIRKGRFINLIFSILCVVFIFMSDSGTGRITTVVLIIFSFLLPIISFNKRTFLPFAILSGLVFLTMITISMLNYKLLLNLLEKDETLTGRTLIWEDAIQAIKAKPFIGYGSQIVYLNEATDEVSLHPGCDTNCGVHATHNTYLTYILNFGLLGLVLFSLAYGTIFLGLLKLLYQRKSPWTHIHLCFFITMMFYQLTLEFYGSMTFWIFFTYLYIWTNTTKNSRPEENASF